MENSFKEGDEIGRLTVLSYVGKNKRYEELWKCKCNCGELITKTSRYLKESKYPSCGCWQKELLVARTKKKNQWTIIDENTVMGTTNNLGGINFLIDKDDYEKCKDICWSAQINKRYNTYYIHGKTEYCGQCEYLHRFIFNLDKTNKNVVDHINHDGTNNKKNNLRIVTHSQNAMNMKNHKNNGIHGVNYKGSSWVCEIWENSNRHYLGFFSNYDDAVKARKEAEKKYFGEFRYDKSMNLEVGLNEV